MQRCHVLWQRCFHFVARRCVFVFVTGAPGGIRFSPAGSVSARLWEPHRAPIHSLALRIPPVAHNKKTPCSGVFFWRARRDSNPRSFESESNTLSTELRAHFQPYYYTRFHPKNQPRKFPAFVLRKKVTDREHLRPGPSYANFCQNMPYGNSMPLFRMSSRISVPFSIISLAR